MSSPFDRSRSRRCFLQFLAASPLFADVGAPAFAQSMSAPSRPPDPMAWAPRDLDNLISDPKEALDVFDFEPVTKKNVPPAHFGYMVTGIDDEVTLRANRQGFLKFQLRPRQFREGEEQLSRSTQKRTRNQPGDTERLLNNLGYL